MGDVIFNFTWMNCIVMADLPTPPPPTTTILYAWLRWDRSVILTAWEICPVQCPVSVSSHNLFYELAKVALFVKNMGRVWCWVGGQLLLARVRPTNTLTHCLLVIYLPAFSVNKTAQRTAERESWPVERRINVGLTEGELQEPSIDLFTTLQLAQTPPPPPTNILPALS